ncbi:hypothetical protein QYZ87_02370 [Porphyromonadaceae bacterium W3.11]|nr:hypothetical protein [Porphyromonadaceae bacterium W3.11]
MMRTKVFMTIVMCLMLISCENKHKKAAEQLQAEAEELVQQEEYEEALILLDSLQKTYPDVVKVRRAAFELSKDVRILQGRRDSILMVPELQRMEAIADSLYHHFTLIEAPDMPDENVLRFKGYDPSTNPSSPFLDCYLSHKGELKLVAGLSATHPIKSSYIKIYDSKGETFVASDTIAYDGGLNYRYEYLSRYYERLTFSPEAAERLASFIAMAPEHEQLRVIFYKEDGHEGPSFSLNSVAREAITGSYQYYNILQQMLDMDTRLRRHEIRLQER